MCAERITDWSFQKANTWIFESNSLDLPRTNGECVVRGGGGGQNQLDDANSFGAVHFLSIRQAISWLGELTHSNDGFPALILDLSWGLLWPNEPPIRRKELHGCFAL